MAMLSCRSHMWKRTQGTGLRPHSFPGARGGTRTHTALLPTDFESVTSTNSITRAYVPSSGSQTIPDARHSEQPISLSLYEESPYPGLFGHSMVSEAGLEPARTFRVRLSSCRLAPSSALLPAALLHLVPSRSLLHPDNLYRICTGFVPASDASCRPSPRLGRWHAAHRDRRGR
jgi:hypothetical protein